GIRVTLDRDVTQRDDPDEVRAVDDRHPAHRVLAHQVYGAVQLVVRADGHRVVAARPGHGGLLRVGAVGERAHHEVAVGDHAAQPVAVRHQDGPEVAVAHHAGHLGDGGVRPHGHRDGGHDVADVLGHGGVLPGLVPGLGCARAVRPARVPGAA